ncbi:MAG: flippase-like domain-containing protein [Anaerolineae bacterium]|jgi:glycosyltransferase 2 family protein|nr:flippase-like domain-containing protein [Anaerolineae bacterium]MBT7782097.1 flippase-like domain-containing protein [Anaerolineae bacterium]
MKTFLQKSKRWLPGAMISIILIAVILNAVDIPKTIAALRDANLSLLLIAAFLSASWLMVRGIVWRTLLQNRPSYRDTFISLGEGYLMNNFLPFRLGELGRAFLLSEKTELKFTEILPTIIVERIFDLIISAAIFITAVSFVAEAKGTEQIAYIIGGIVLLAIIMLYFLAHNQEWAFNFFTKITARIPKLQELGGELLKSLLAGLSVFTDGALFLRFIFWMLFNWSIALIQFTLIITAFFPQATVIWGMFGLGAAAFGGAIPSLPGAIGTLEAAIGGALNLLSNDMSTSFAVALVVRLFNYTFSGIVGIYGLTTEGETLSGIYQQLMDYKNKPN